MAGADQGLEALPANRRVLVQRQVRTNLVVIFLVGIEQMEQMPFAEPNGLPARNSGCLLLASYFAAVVCPTSMLSLSSSPWIRGGPQTGFARLPPSCTLGRSILSERLQFCDGDGSELCDDEVALQVRRSAMN